MRSGEAADSPEHRLEYRRGPCCSVKLLRIEFALYVASPSTICNHVQSPGAAGVSRNKSGDDPSFAVCSTSRHRPSLVDLPLGSEPGTYQLQICRNGRTDPLVTVSGSAVLQPNGSTVLAVELNSTRLSVGPYALGFWKDDADWSYSPLLVRDPTGG